mmetsp:Transcript_702/g.1987  ORF Transcript_702/g.1987 Transcript_702/m.1987 type:complete len:217 (-) Transcript_702:933-1583(-)
MHPKVAPVGQTVVPGGDCKVGHEFLGLGGIAAAERGAHTDVGIGHLRHVRSLELGQLLLDVGVHGGVSPIHGIVGDQIPDPKRRVERHRHRRPRVAVRRGTVGHDADRIGKRGRHLAGGGVHRHAERHARVVGGPPRHGRHGNRHVGAGVRHKVEPGLLDTHSPLVDVLLSARGPQQGPPTVDRVAGASPDIRSLKPRVVKPSPLEVCPHRPHRVV